MQAQQVAPWLGSAAIPRHAGVASMLAVALLGAGPARVGLGVSASQASDCSRTSVGFTPLIDLGAGTYHGYEGGLYAGGSNERPPAHDAAGVAIANAIVPLDTLGNPDPVHGRIVLISIGMSNTTMEFSAFVPKAQADPMRNPQVFPIDCAEGGQAAGDINHPDAPYWDTVFSRLRSHGSAPAQVQAVWLKEAERSPNGPFPATAETLMRDLGAIVRIIEDKMPNVRLCYITSRIYGGYASTTLNPEPYAYESGFAVKWLIQGQIVGVDSLNFDPASGPVGAPWLSWGPYLWADGLTPRSDGLTWSCDEFNTDGTHPSDLGRNVVADSLLSFFHRDPTASPWFVRVGVAGVESAGDGEALSIALAPNPISESIAMTVEVRVGRPWRLEVFDASGRRTTEVARGVGTGSARTLRWHADDDHGVRVHAGIYWARLTAGSDRVARRFVVR